MKILLIKKLEEEAAAAAFCFKCTLLRLISNDRKMTLPCNARTHTITDTALLFTFLLLYLSINA
jgi:hypothetical protein